MISEILSEADSLVAKSRPFEFWELLNKAEKGIEAVEESIGGEIEAHVVVKGKLVLGKGSFIKSGSRIEGSVYIGENCTIGPNAFLRPGTIIADNCHIGTSEIKSSIILSGSNVPHFSYVGDSVIGRKCNLGAGTKIANLRHDNRNIMVILDGKKVDSGRRKLGALLFDGVKTGINSSINCGAILGKGAKVKPGEFVK